MQTKLQWNPLTWNIKSLIFHKGSAWISISTLRDIQKVNSGTEILPPLLPGLELATFRSRVRRSTHKLSPGTAAHRNDIDRKLVPLPSPPPPTHTHTSAVARVALEYCKGWNWIHARIAETRYAHLQIPLCQRARVQWTGTPNPTVVESRAVELGLPALWLYNQG